MGLIHIYIGDGKGKTTAAVGLGVRVVGSGMRVLMTQFLKNGKSSELSSLERLSPEFELLFGTPVEKFYPFLKPEEQSIVCDNINRAFEQVKQKAYSGDYRLVILDEIIDTVELGIIPLEKILGFLKDKPLVLEVVITGHKTYKELDDIADYVTEMKKIKHPYDNGICARKGIEY